MSDLLTLDDIARLWKIKREQARRHLTKLPEFPDPAPGSTRKNKRWDAQQVLQFLSGNQQTPA